MTIVCDYRLIIFCSMTIFIGLYSATRRNYFRFVVVNFVGNVDRKQPDTAGNDSDSRPQCSFSVFRKYLRLTSSNYLPGDGRWKRRAGKLVRFHPDLCSLSYGSWVPRDRLVHCFARLNVSYVAILGDSNALRLWGTVRQTLSRVGVPRVLNCDPVRHDDDVITPKLPARRCTSNYLALRRFLPPKYFRCEMTDGRLPVASLLVQYLPVTGDTKPIDAGHNITTTTGCVDDETNTFVQTQASTVPEFLFGEYFATPPHPDIVLYMSSSWEQNSLPVYADIVDKFAKLLQRIKTRLPASTRLVVVPRPDEYVPLKPEVWRSRRYEPGNMTRNEWITASNHILHARLAQLFGEFQGGPQLLLFPDIAAVMRPVIDELAVDGVHSNIFWYKILWSYITQTICSGYM